MKSLTAVQNKIRTIYPHFALCLEKAVCAMNSRFTKKQWFVWAAAVSVLIMGSGIAIVFTILDPNLFKDNITQAVHKAVGRELVIGGRIHLSVFPWLGLRVSDISLANPPDFGKDAMVRIQEADIHIRLIPLLSRKIETRILVLKQPEVYLIRDQNGLNNWDFKRKSDKQESSESSSDILKDLMVAGVKISDGKVVFEDRQKKTAWRFSNVNIESGAVKIGEPIAGKLKFDLDSDSPKLSLALSTEHLTADIGNSLLKADDLNLSYKIAPLLDISLKTALSLDWKSELLNLTHLNLSGFGLNIDGDAQTEHLFSKPDLTASLSIREFSPKQWVANTADPQAMTRASAKFRLAMNSDATQFSDIMLKLDDTTVQGKIIIRQFKPIHTNFDLSADHLDLNRYLAPSSEKKQRAEERKQKLEHHNPLENTQITGNLHIGQFRVNKLSASDIRMTILEKDGKLNLKPLLASLYGGNLNSDVSLDFGEKTLPITISLNASGINTGEIFRDFSGKNLISGGRSDLSLKLSAQSYEFVKTMSGKADLKTANAVLKGYNIPGLIEMTGYPFKALLQKVKAYREEPAETPIQSLIARLDIRSGNAVIRELVLKTPNMTMNGTGSTNIAARTIDTKLSMDFDQIVNLPVSISGTYQKPEFFVNPAGVVFNSALNIVGLPIKLGKEVITNPKEVGKKIIEAPVNLGESIFEKAKGLFGNDNKESKKKKKK